MSPTRLLNKLFSPSYTIILTVVENVHNVFSCKPSDKTTYCRAQVQPLGAPEDIDLTPLSSGPGNLPRPFQLCLLETGLGADQEPGKGTSRDAGEQEGGPVGSSH